MDLQHYTRSLVTEEMNLGNMLEAAVRDIMIDREREASIDVEDSDEDSELFNYETQELDDDDFIAYNEMIENEIDKDWEEL